MDIGLLFSSVKLLQPNWLWLIFPLLVFLLIQNRLIKRGVIEKPGQQTYSAAVKHPLAINALVDASNKHSSHPIGYTLLCSSLLMLALAQPVRFGEVIKTPATSADVMLIIDTSISMVIKDYHLDGKPVDRMSMTQALLTRFSNRFSGKRIGIVVLGELPQILLKPSEDKNLVNHLINRLKSTVAGRQAALGDAVIIATDYLIANKLTAQTVLILISDGVKPSGRLSPIEGANRAAKAGVILHTIAIGSTNELNVKLAASFMGELIYEAADVDLLKKMAKLTGGESFHGIDVEAIDTALKKIELQHKKNTSIELLPRLQQPLYAWPLLAALFLIITKQLFSNLRTKVQAI
ncbi:hypothetical protein MNBD_GAMMA07-920 [hydrothermal vent metagenome]|uniref:VWFA domain-containing protein n=1 Tax=hydrothermal vent metagenome TaxID=652676 RepID=A0A3B0XIK5_9ZZZZ